MKSFSLKSASSLIKCTRYKYLLIKTVRSLKKSNTFKISVFSLSFSYFQILNKPGFATTLCPEMDFVDELSNYKKSA